MCWALTGRHKCVFCRWNKKQMYLSKLVIENTIRKKNKNKFACGWAPGSILFPNRAFPSSIRKVKVVVSAGECRHWDRGQYPRSWLYWCLIIAGRGFQSPWPTFSSARSQTLSTELSLLFLLGGRFNRKRSSGWGLQTRTLPLFCTGSVSAPEVFRAPLKGPANAGCLDSLTNKTLLDLNVPDLRSRFGASESVIN